MTELNTQTPVEIDTEIARLEGEQSALYYRLSKLREEKRLAAEHDYFDVDLLTTKIGELVTQLDELHAKILPLNEEFHRRGGWARYYVVDNNNGHVHTTTDCPTTYRSTDFCWLTGLSGAPRAEAVALGGAQTCLVCFGEFRAEIEAGRPTRLEGPKTKAAREEREKAAAAKAAKIEAAKTKAITNPDGTPLVIEDLGKRMIKTEIAAQRAASQAAFDLCWYGSTHPDVKEWQNNLRICVAALAAKREVDGAALHAEFLAKARKKVVKDGGEPQH